MMHDDPYQSRQYKEALLSLSPETRQRMLRGEWEPVTLREATMPDAPKRRAGGQAMVDPPKRIWIPEGDLPPASNDLIDNALDAAIYGPCVAYVPALEADEVRRQRDLLLEALKRIQTEDAGRMYELRGIAKDALTECGASE